ncbi:hypothetical protein [Umezawaea sp. Da 62-37]|uniref:hypothetical protein n=1 Tax=Umezawaea sp. Da 62-37 TaxID=3075927 RepID=UPI0028F73AA1|nr:hypothetical protein [Umezawaea sp. Da 62-37]WNV85287.1 hypothetical protein RM788_45410 [Umezawaea sp. Da 62-37]
MAIVHTSVTPNIVWTALTMKGNRVVSSKTAPLVWPSTPVGLIRADRRMSGNWSTP